MAKQQDSLDTNPSLIGKIVAIMPASLPAKIYNALSIIPAFKKIMNQIILSRIPTQIDIAEGTIMLDQTDVAVSGSLAIGAFEKTEIDLFRRCLKPGMTVVDIGANIGYYTVIAAKNIGSNGKLFAYEPENRNYSFLEKNIGINKLTNVIPFKIGISDKKGTNKLYLDDDNKGRHSFVFNEDKSAISIETDTLDESLRRYGSPTIDIIKIDIEGAEFLALQGMKETIKRSPNLIIFSELYPKGMRKLGGDPRKYLENLVESGFSLSIIDGDSNKVTPISDIQEFVDYFPGGEAFRNIIASKIG
ncbi:MAG: FkbM family methyltransferase [Candidatus Taylorbacteria bacterium]|nr:FkbM family methyltransferase [Candidatus Taylorbacteria bacterium]